MKQTSSHEQSKVLRPKIAESNIVRPCAPWVYYRAKHVEVTKTEETLVLAARSLAWSWGEMAIALVTYAMGGCAPV
jgi:hypothetical protein